MTYSYNPPQTTETRIAGAWTEADARVVADEPTRRIEWLVDHYLERVADTPDGWTTLLRDPADRRYWELSHPFSDSHGGGPPQLVVITPVEARARYPVDI